jgi:hypothetical protein
MRWTLRSLAAVLLTVVFAHGAFGWGNAGHKIIASIAFRQLTPDQQKKIVKMLQAHERFQEDFASRKPDGVEESEWTVQQAAIWPDMVKSMAPDVKKAYSRPLWHYIDLPYFPTDSDRDELKGKLTLNTSFDVPQKEDEGMNVVQATKFAQQVLADPRASDETKAKYLCWLMHLVGDAHQPLHAATLCTVDLFPGGDHGGNWIPTVQHRELHAVWDDFPGPSGIKFAAVRNKAVALIGTVDMKAAGEAAAKDLSVETWVKESHELAERSAYTQDVIEHLDGETNHKKLAPLDLDDEYLKDGGSISQKRLVEAGFRLGALLKGIAGN